MPCAAHSSPPGSSPPPSLSPADLRKIVRWPRALSLRFRTAGQGNNLSLQSSYLFNRWFFVCIRRQGMTNLVRTLRFGFRLLAKNLGFTSVALLALTLGIGANTAIFTVVYAALLSPLPYPNPDQLVMVWSKVNGHNNSVSAGDYLDWKRQNAVFQDVVAWSSGSFSLSISGHPEAMRTRITSPGFFDMQGIPLFLGRDFVSEEGQVGKDHVLIMTNRLWRERFGSDPQII